MTKDVICNRCGGDDFRYLCKNCDDNFDKIISDFKARETAMLEEIEKPLKEKCFEWQEPYAINQIQEALSIIQRRKGGK